jgi:threonylcarbamoyladenosine tRNA methylthiotransferase MtaB
MSGKVSFYTLGCKLNYSESSSLARQMADEGFEVVPFRDGADIYVINTCSVTENADRKCRKVVKQALKFNASARIVVVGCYAQLKPDEIATIPGVSLVLGAAEKFNLHEHVKRLSEDGPADVIAGEIENVRQFSSAFSFLDRTRTFLKVQDGCDYNCSFCTIPLARGASRSDTVENAVQQAQALAEQGVKEIVLTGVNLGDFGKNSNKPGQRNESFFSLIRELDKVPRIERFRISSIEPNLLSDEIIRFVADSQKFVPHFHIPLQSGSDKILKKMRRRYLSALYEDRVNLIKELMPDACIGVDVITGFPGETEQDFLDTYRFLNELDISYLHVFTYSERDNTVAIEMSDVVPLKERESRTAQLINLSEKKKRYFYESQVGSRRPVLFEAETDGKLMSGFTDNYVKVTTDFDPLLVNEIAWVKLENLQPEIVFHEIEVESDTLTLAQKYSNDPA